MSGRRGVPRGPEDPGGERGEPGSPGRPGAPTFDVTTVYHVAVCSYTWMVKAAGYGAGPERGSEHGTGTGAQRKTLPQNTPEYGRRVAGWLAGRNVDFVTGYWSGDPRRPCIENFDASLGALGLDTLGSLRLSSMFSMAPPLRRVKAAIEERAPRLLSQTSARLVDKAGRERIPIFLWWGDSRVSPSEFKATIAELRSLFAARFGGASPFFVSTHHALWTRNDDVIRSLDAVYRHECHHLYDEGGHPRRLTTQESVEPTRANWRADVAALQGKVAFGSGLPVFYMVGTMPSFFRPADKKRGKVIAEDKSQIRAMFAALRDDARALRVARPAPRTLELHKWVAITSLSEWVENSTIEPCVIRPNRSPAEVAEWGYDYGTDALDLIRDLFRPTTRSVPEAEADRLASL